MFICITDFKIGTIQVYNWVACVLKHTRHSASHYAIRKSGCVCMCKLIAGMLQGMGIQGAVHVTQTSMPEAFGGM